MELKQKIGKLFIVAPALFMMSACGSKSGGQTTITNAARVPVTAGYGQPPPAPGSQAAPVVRSFSASASAITTGDNAVLKWDVSGADTVTLKPFPGVVSGNSITVAPKTSTTFSIVATKGNQTASKKLSIQVLSGASDWDVTVKPPAMTGARKIDVSKVSPVKIPSQSINCAGLVRDVKLGGSEDAVVYMSGSKPLRYPLRITGGRNVRVVGLEFAIVTQAGCGVGRLPNLPVASHPNANIHPRVPGGIVLRLEQAKTSFVEGLNIDVKGHEADCIVARNPDSMSSQQAQKQRDVVIQNTWCAGVEGMGNTRIGDGVHGDLFQNQGRDIMRRLVFENVSMRSSQEGIVLHGDGSLPGARSLLLRRYDYTWDPRYVGDDNYESFGLAFAGWPGPDWTLEDVRIDDFRSGADYIRIKDQRYGNSPGGDVIPHPQIRSGRPPEGAFALQQRTGTRYRSPHGGVPAG